MNKRNISPNKIILPLSDNENGILDDYIQTDDINCQETFTCSICQCLVWDPVFCSSCDKPFCRSCRFEYGENRKCPFKCDTSNLREITRNEKDYLNKIRIKCTNNGCSKYIKYFDYKTHLENCELRKYHCKNDPCKEEGFINDMINHPPICPYRKVVCTRCKGKVKFSDFDMHKSCLCPENIIKCKYCNSSMKRGTYLKEHQSKNNDNPNCLKKQIENLKRIYEVKLKEKNNLINSLNIKITLLEKKENHYKKENVDLKKCVEEMKSFFKKGYNKFISEEKNEINIENVLNNNDEIKKINLTAKKELDSSNIYEKIVSNTGNNFYPSNRKNNIKKRFLNENKYILENIEFSNMTDEKIMPHNNDIIIRRIKKVPSQVLLTKNKIIPSKNYLLNKK